MHYARAFDWRPALRLVEFIAIVYGLPAAIAAHARMLAPRAEALSARLAELEAMLRKLIDRLAAAMPDFKARGAFPALPPGPAGRCVASMDSRDWQVSFRFAPAKHARRTHDRSPSFTPLMRGSMPLAERFEAAMRVLADPERYARRQKRHIARRRVRAYAPPRYRPVQRWPLTYAMRSAPAPTRAPKPDDTS